MLRAISQLGGFDEPPASGAHGNPQEAQEGIARWREAIADAFVSTHGMLEASTAAFLRSSAATYGEAPEAPRIDARVSGTTATVVLVLPGGRLLVAHVGDSRAVLGRRRRGSTEKWRCVELSRDHKPELPEERARIIQAGATITDEHSQLARGRIYTPNQTWSAINMTRSLGDLHAHTQGLSPIAEVSAPEKMWDPATEDAVIIVASDGVWDVMTAEDAVQLAVGPRHDGEPSEAVAREAYSRWQARPGFEGYSDDISAV